MSLMAQVQNLTEYTYRQKTGVNFENFIIGYRRFRALSSQARFGDLLSDAARVFFRVDDQRLFLAIYFDPALIRILERHDPRLGLNENNIRAFMLFVEEINHAVHGALKFMEGKANVRDEDFVRDLELQARVDVYLLLKYFVACFNRSRQLERLDRMWLRHHVFERESFDYDADTVASRYREANELGEKFSRFLEGLPIEERADELARFRERDYGSKKRYIRLVTN